MKKKKLIGLKDKNLVPLRDGDVVTNGKARLAIEYNIGYFAYVCYLDLFKRKMKFLYELSDVIEEKYWVIQRSI